MKRNGPLPTASVMLVKASTLASRSGITNRQLVVTFDEAGPVAQAMLTYGQSTNPRSPYYTDQLGVFSRKEWPLLPFAQDKIKADPNYQLLTLTE